MKKIIILMTLVMSSILAYGQLRTSRTFVKTPTRMDWILRVGCNIDNITGLEIGHWLEETSSKYGGVSLDFGFNRFFKDEEDEGDKIYWGMEIGLNSRGMNFMLDQKAGSYLAHTIKFTPINLGFRYQLSDLVEIDPHIGLWGDYRYNHKLKNPWEKNDIYDNGIDLNFNSDNYFNLGYQIGFGIWFDDINIDLMYQRSFFGNPLYGSYYYYHEDDWLKEGWRHIDYGKGKISNISLRIGVRF